jgi:hypothetical protein
MMTMFSWEQRAVARASTTRLADIRGDAASRNLRATLRPSLRSRASMTRAMPPRPSSRMIS